MTVNFKKLAEANGDRRYGDSDGTRVRVKGKKLALSLTRFQAPGNLKKDDAGARAEEEGG